MTAAWTREAVEALGPTTDVPTMASILDVHKDTIYALIRRGEWTATRVLPLGRKLKIPTRDLVDLLYPSEPALQVSPAVPSQCQHIEYPQVTASTPHASCGCTPVESAVIRPLRGA
ncbi:helix-turn-helix domain-containing protein [Streptomyces sp. NBC_00620]|uniref:helix-turn-helix domain-containing protein n=1 Tax=Streptomyces sp. NBC_00620 TaxID=2903666 RepID=UPI0022560592|nr:helix-turn-helix domain-containing protein [Streptomyces sp. NBC_00620]MCX4973144.1 helix-turn-helix domain-containing protein [Streptomyces sp. NBC_00620]